MYEYKNVDANLVVTNKSIVIFLGVNLIFSLFYFFGTYLKKNPFVCNCVQTDMASYLENLKNFKLVFSHFIYLRVRSFFFLFFSLCRFRTLFHCLRSCKISFIMIRFISISRGFKIKLLIIIIFFI